jgi:hypothetical protein
VLLEHPRRPPNDGAAVTAWGSRVEASPPADSTCSRVSPNRLAEIPRSQAPDRSASTLMSAAFGSALGSAQRWGRGTTVAAAAVSAGLAGVASSVAMAGAALAALPRVGRHRGRCRRHRARCRGKRPCAGHHRVRAMRAYLLDMAGDQAGARTYLRLAARRTLSNPRAALPRVARRVRPVSVQAQTALGSNRPT